MAEILIKGMGMPKGNDYLHLIIQRGKVHTAISCGHLTTDKLNVADAIEVKPHGRLIDSDELQEVLRIALSLVITNELTEKEISLVHRTIGAISDCVNELDTVLEATE